MESSISITRLNQMSLSAYRLLFTSLTTPTVAVLSGTYRATLIGPGWLRRSAMPGLRLLGMPGWWGKRFDGVGGGVNLVMRDGRLQPIIPIRAEARASVIDGLPAIAVVYPPTTRFPWPYVVDELRQLDAKRLLGLTYVNRLALRRVLLPFLLEFT